MDPVPKRIVKDEVFFGALKRSFPLINAGALDSGEFPGAINAGPLRASSDFILGHYPKRVWLTNRYPPIKLLLGRARGPLLFSPAAGRSYNWQYIRFWI